MEQLQETTNETKTIRPAFCWATVIGAAAAAVAASNFDL